MPIRSRAPLAALLVGAAVALGCAHAPPATIAADANDGRAPHRDPHDPKDPSDPSDSDAPPRHGAHGAARPIALPHRVLDGTSGSQLGDAALATRLGAAKVIYVGEQHPNPHDHAAQLEVLERAFAADPALGLGLEMLPRTMQAALDDYVSGRSDEATFLRAVDWSHTWGFDFGLYRPLLELCRAHHLPAFALNAPRALAREIAHHGLDGLAPEARRALPDLMPGPAAHRELVREAWAQHPHGRFGDAGFERFYAAQLVWDETMAESVARALSGPRAPARLVVIAGEGHTRRFAVPDRAARRGAKPYLTVLPVLASDAADARGLADVLWELRTDGAGQLRSVVASRMSR